MFFRRCPNFTCISDVLVSCNCVFDKLKAKLRLLRYCIPKFAPDLKLISTPKSRNLALSLSNTQLQETNTSEIQVKFGHRLKNIYIKALDFNLDAAAKKKPVKKKDEDLVAPSGEATADPKAKKKKEPKAKKGNDLVLNFDLSFRDDITVNHNLSENIEVQSRGSQTFRVSPSATYTLNKRLDLRFYVDYNRTIPYTTAAFPSTTATGGFVVTFKLN